MAEPAQTDRAETSSEAEEPKSREAFLAQAKKRWERASAAESVNRKNAVEDLKFKQGEQWPEAIKSDRALQKRPCLTINKMKTFVHQITNDQRQNRPAISVSPIGEGSDPKTAKMLKGLIKQIERVSDADFAYDTGFDSAVSNGWGYWRILTEYEDEDSFDQVIKIDAITNPFRVYLDPDHKSPTGSDAQWGFISDLLPRSEFEEQFPDKDPLEWQEQGMGDEYKEWSTLTHIRIAEYFYYETKNRKLVALATGHIGYEDELAPDIQAQIKADSSLVVKERDVPCKYLKWCKLTAKQVLEENEWPGKYIPIVKVIGDMVDVEGKVNLAGLIRDAKDPQRMYNYWCTAETELIALAPKAPWIMEEGQIEGHEQRWKEANVKSFPYLLYKGTSLSGKPSPAPQRQPFVGVPTGIVEAKAGASQDMQATTGLRFDATMHERLANESGKAMLELKRVGDLGSFHYVDNLSRSLKHTGRILIDLIPHIYDTPRVLTILREDNTEEHVKIDPNLQTPAGKDGDRSIFNPKMGRYEVAVTVGPSFATKRAEASESMMQFLKVVPNSAPLISDLIAKNMDWPGSEEIAERLAAMLPPQIAQMLGKDMKDLPPEAKALIANLSTQLQQAQQENQQAKALLGDKEADRQIEKDKIQAGREKADKDLEAKLTKIAADMEVALRGLVDGPIQEVTAAVQDMQTKFTENQHAQEIAELERQHDAEKRELEFKASQERAQADQEQQAMKNEAKVKEAGAKASEKSEPKESPKPPQPIIHVHNYPPSGKKKGTIGGKKFEITSE